jgi:hypothetical protein
VVVQREKLFDGWEVGGWVIWALSRRSVELGKGDLHLLGLLGSLFLD